MQPIKFFNLQILLGFLILCNACNSSSPKEAPKVSDTLTTVSEQKIEYEKPPLPFTKISSYDGTVETARKQIAEIKNEDMIISVRYGSL